MNPYLKSLISKMLQKDPRERIQVHEIFDSEWVTKEGTDPIELNEEDFIAAYDDGIEDGIIAVSLTMMIITMTAKQRIEVLN